MRYLVTVLLAVLMVGCAHVAESPDLNDRYPLRVENQYPGTVAIYVLDGQQPKKKLGIVANSDERTFLLDPRYARQGARLMACDEDFGLNRKNCHTAHNNLLIGKKDPILKVTRNSNIWADLY